MLRAATLAAALVASAPPASHALTAHAAAQDQAAAAAAAGGAPQRPGDAGTPEREMLFRAEVRREEESHKEMVERADEAAQLGDQILASYRKNNSLTREDLKRLERLEKLARKIRGNAGGSDDKEGLDDPPGKVEGAVSRLAKISGALKESVLKTSRLVVSATVIQRSNELIELIRHIRSLKQP